MTDSTIWQFINYALINQKTQAVLLLIVVDSQGSTPAKIGAKMAVTATQTLGTIGGGAIEHNLIKKARHLLQQTDFHHQISEYHHKPHHNDASGMICGGSQTILIYACQLAELPLYQRLASGESATLMLSRLGLQLSPSNTNTSFTIQANDWCYQETINTLKQAYIIGGGHVSLALSRILATLNYQITVFEQRHHIDSFTRNHYAHHKQHISYQQLHHLINEGEQSYVFIMTHSHKTDALALAQIHHKHVAYLGLLGSQQKIAHLTRDYQIPHLHAPMGLNIHSHTPEEIAISIAAELIQLANQC